MATGAHGCRIGVDIGGTFTDLVWVDDATGAICVGKLLTTPKEPAQAVEQGVVSLLHEAGAHATSVRAVIHGTTLVTNALIERKGARTGLLTTEGFRDAIEIGREGRYDMYDLFIDPPAPLAPRHLRREVRERMLADGGVGDAARTEPARARRSAPSSPTASRPSRSACSTRTGIPRTSRRSPRSSASSPPGSRCPRPPRSCPRSASTSARRPPSPTST